MKTLIPIPNAIINSRMNSNKHFDVIHDLLDSCFRFDLEGDIV
jgi:hypothetical protein